MSKRSCKYFLLLACVLDHPEARDHHIARFARLVRRSYEESGTRYAPVRIRNEDLARFWKCNEPAARACLADMKRFKWIDTRQVGQYEREIILIAAWRNDGTDSAEDTNAPSISALHLAAQATATPLPARSSDDLSAQGANHVSTLPESPNVVVERTNPAQDIDFQQQQVLGNPGCTALEGANHTSTLNEGAPKRRTLAELRQSLSAEGYDRILDGLQALGLTSVNVLLELAVLPHVTEEYLDRAVAYAVAHPDLGPGWWTMQIRAGWQPPIKDPPILWQEEADRAGFDMCNAEEGSASPRGDEPPASLYRRDGVAGIWSAALNELKLQMTRSTFDTWLRASRALGWDGDNLVVGVHSEYAKEWLENRLHCIVQRVVAEIVGRAVTVRYEVT